MRLYRVHPWVDGVDPVEPYGALFTPPGQGAGRWDNPDLYSLRYFAATPAGAVAETFGALAQWSEGMLRVPARSDAVKALSIYEIPDFARLTDLADPEVLLSLDIHRVTDVIERNKRRTQRLAAGIYGSGDWEGISWWSYYHPTITLVATWLDEGIDVVETLPLDMTDDVMQQAAGLIVRVIRRP